MACFGHPIKHLSPAVDIAIILLSDKLFPHPLYLGRRRDSSDHTANHLAVTVTFLEAYKMGSDVEGATEYYNTLPAQPSAPSHNYQAANAPWDSVNDNIQSRHEDIVLDPGQKKVEEEVDTRVPNACIFTFNKEDHTLGNVLRARLFDNPHVKFSGYKVPHPLVPKFELRVQTDGSITPKEALMTATTELVSDLGTLSQEFTKEYELRKMAQTTQNGD